MPKSGRDVGFPAYFWFGIALALAVATIAFWFGPSYSGTSNLFWGPSLPGEGDQTAQSQAVLEQTSQPFPPSHCAGAAFHPELLFRGLAPLDNPAVWTEDLYAPGYWSTFQNPDVPKLVVPEGLAMDITLWDGPNARVLKAGYNDETGKIELTINRQGELNAWCP